MFSVARITELLKTYEESHAVEDYIAAGWRVWPYVRTQLAYRLRSLERGGVEAPQRKRRLAFLGNHGQFLRRALSGLLSARNRRRAVRRALRVDPRRNVSADGAEADVVVMVPSNRRVRGGGRLYNVFADPLVSVMDGLGMRSVTWEWGPERGPRWAPSAFISARLEHESVRDAGIASQQRPSWWAEISGWFASVSGSRVEWEDLEPGLGRIGRASVILERWLRRTRAKALIVCCWYSQLSMAATLAARRVGASSCDVQHGIQGVTHFGYGGWLRSPAGGYEVVPDVFWTWGPHYAESIAAGNPAFVSSSRATVGGNLWMNTWRQGNFPGQSAAGELASGICRKAARSILVTLQSDGVIPEVLTRAIGASPPGWLWLLRYHPGTEPHVAEYMKGRIAALDASRVETSAASRLPLYALLSCADVHVTRSSTCAIEALAFGVPTVLVERPAGGDLGDLVERGTMLHASDPQELLACLTRADALTPEKCRSASGRYLASGGREALILRGLTGGSGEQS